MYKFIIMVGPVTRVGVIHAKVYHHYVGGKCKRGAKLRILYIGV
jgi:hypothetical protein